MKQLRVDCDDECVKAITGGEYTMKYTYFSVTTNQWFKMTVKQRDTICQKVESDDHG